MKKEDKLNKYKLCIEIKKKSNLQNSKLIISFDLCLSKIEDKKILKRKNIKKFGKALIGNMGVTEHTTEDIYIESKHSILFKKSIEKQKLKILSKENEEYKAKKTEFIPTESKNDLNIYCPPKRSMTSEEDNCVLYLSGYPAYVEEEEIYLKINDYLNNKKFKYILSSKKKYD